MWQSNRVRSIVALVAALLGAGVVAAPPASAGPTVCDYPACTPGIMPHQVLGAPCDNTTYYAFGGRRRLRLLRLGTRTVDVLRVAEAIPASMVPLPAHGWGQGRKRRLHELSELCRAGARWPVPDLYRSRRHFELGPRRHVASSVAGLPGQTEQSAAQIGNPVEQCVVVDVGDQRMHDRGAERAGEHRRLDPAVEARVAQ